eukprot:TRINITY_DN18370_c0_g1_i4.p1 TRINITY_DN18370_c0_g1~~TRINITY_DN18370_c0_g1_i4.p1  ORF type:complete len:183 (-),score=22.83 TRINITY_DN18370_c0_g1_i4:297-773(-)
MQGGHGIHGTPSSTWEHCGFKSTAVPITKDKFENLARQFKHLQEQLREQLRSVRCVHSESLAAAASGTPLFALESSVDELHHFPPPPACDGIPFIDAVTRPKYFESSVSDVRISTLRKPAESDVATTPPSKPYVGSLPFQQEVSHDVVISIEGDGNGQ